MLSPQVDRLMAACPTRWRCLSYDLRLRLRSRSAGSPAALLALTGCTRAVCAGVCAHHQRRSQTPPRLLPLSTAEVDPPLAAGAVMPNWQGQRFGVTAAA
jgi:hypothetical protein